MSVRVVLHPLATLMLDSGNTARLLHEGHILFPPQLIRIPPYPT